MRPAHDMLSGAIAHWQQWHHSLTRWKVTLPVFAHIDPCCLKTTSIYDTTLRPEYLCVYWQVNWLLGFPRLNDTACRQHRRIIELVVLKLVPARTAALCMGSRCVFLEHPALFSQSVNCEGCTYVPWCGSKQDQCCTQSGRAFLVWPNLNWFTGIYILMHTCYLTL